MWCVCISPPFLTSLAAFFSLAFAFCSAVPSPLSPLSLKRAGKGGSSTAAVGRVPSVLALSILRFLVSPSWSFSSPLRFLGALLGRASKDDPTDADGVSAGLLPLSLLSAFLPLSLSACATSAAGALAGERGRGCGCVSVFLSFFLAAGTALGLADPAGDKERGAALGGVSDLFEALFFALALAFLLRIFSTICFFFHLRLAVSIWVSMSSSRGVEKCLRLCHVGFLKPSQ
mmetsp:Transcript_51304/g.128861  ORF Transcript_51304/g.128861 Transcript_51304/m.128861 type:complete len:231 (-) Transcript_51304:407-1099(-)